MKDLTKNTVVSKLELYEKFRKVPAEALKTIGAGRLKGMSDINPMWRIKRLTEEFGACGFGWYPEVVKREIIEGSDGQKVAFISLNLYVKIDNEWSKPIYGEGGASFVANEKRGTYTNDEAFKMAYTDAISICCKMLGMAADVYYAKDRTKYSENAPQQKPIDYDFLIKEAKTVTELTKIYNSMPAAKQADNTIIELIKSQRQTLTKK